VKLLAKLSGGVLEVTAGDECRHAELSLLERAYLIWTFRNFRRLSVRVLNQPQREMVERLSQTAHVAETKKINPKLIIGRVEFAAFPVRKVLIVESAPSTSKMQHAVFRMPSMSSAHQLAKLPRLIAHHAAEALATSSRRTRSRARYSLILTLATASLVVISGALAQRLWIKHSEPTASTGAPSKPAAPEQAGTVTGIRPVAVTIAPIAKQEAVPGKAVTPSKPAAPEQAGTVTGIKPIAVPATLVTKQETVSSKAVTPTALRTPPQPTSSAQDRVKATTPAPVPADGGVPDAKVDTASSRLRVFLAPRSVIYPTIPNSGLSGHQTKQIFVKAIVNSNGLVDDVQVPGQDPSLATAIAKTVRQWRYQPYVRNGQAVEVETHMIFTVSGPDAITVRFLPPGENPAND